MAFGRDTGDAVKEYDFIVCGGGTAGCVIAGRLAEDPNTSILVIEAGPHSDDLGASHVARGSYWLHKKTKWDFISEPSANADDRQFSLFMGKILGGSSYCNAALCIRGCRQDFDDWDVPGWSGDDFFRCMKKTERYHGKPDFAASTASHGYKGHLHIEPPDHAPISELMRASFESKGLPWDADMFSHGERPNGCGGAVRSLCAGKRSTSADFITGENQRPNITTVAETCVDKIVIERQGQDGSLVAVGVRAVAADGNAVEFRAKKEVIVSGGAYNSPLILARSGIGSKEELQAHNVPVLVDLPGVGKNLMDHTAAVILYETEKPGLTLDHMIYHGEAGKKTRELLRHTDDGSLIIFPVGTVAYARLDSRLADSDLWKDAPRRHPGRDPLGMTEAQPSIELVSFESFADFGVLHDMPADGRYVFGILPLLFRGRARGTVSLRSSKATDLPVVRSPVMEDELDIEIMAEACRLGQEIVLEGEGTRGIVKGGWPPESGHEKFVSREDWRGYLKKEAHAAWHPAGTCVMGRRSNPQAVVDEELCVMGVRGLRVADCSIMPSLPGGHSQMMAYGIGEKAAELIKARYGISEPSS